MAKIGDALNDLKEKEDEGRIKLAAVENHRKHIKNRAVAIFTDARDSLLDKGF